MATAFAPTDALQAARLWGLAEQLRETSGTPHHPVGREREEREVAELRQAFGDDASFDRAWQEGRSMDLRTAVDVALRVDGPLRNGA